MTVISVSEKKKTQLEEPLVAAEHPAHVLPPKNDVESYSPTAPTHVAIHRVHSATTVCLFLVGMLVMSVGIVGGIYFYQQWAHKPIQRLRGIFNVPINNSEGRHLYYFDPARLSGNQKLENTDGYFTEHIEADALHERIEVPAFNGSQHGVFIHDFEVNITAIADNKHCFVMPLNRHRVLPPESLFDFILKNAEGYYDVDTETVRETMRVQVPPIKNMAYLGKPIAQECYGKKTYKLVSDGPRVYKRSAETPAVFRAFAGKTMEIAIANYPEAIEADT